MKVYKLRHIPTGLYFVTTQGGWRKKTNLNKTGKVYTRFPSFQMVKQIYVGEENPRAYSVDTKKKIGK